jgi:zinc transport system ATP-binding protein
METERQEALGGGDGRSSAPGEPKALVVRHLSVAFGPKEVFKDLSFEVPEGTSLAIIGPNGAGKTLLFKALIGAIPHTGEVAWASGTRIGYVPQKLDIERDLPVSGWDFLVAKAGVASVPPGEVDRVLELVKLRAAVARQPLGTLSGGQFQRLLLAFALMGHPTVLLCDEPTAGVDEAGEEGLYAMIKRVQEQDHLTLLLISHELNIVYRYAQNVLCLSHGHGATGPPVDILAPGRLQALYDAPVGFHFHPGHEND